jgi:hypothetical protein
MPTTVTKRVQGTASGGTNARVSNSPSESHTARVDGYTALDGLALEGDQADGVLLLEGDQSDKLLLEGDQQGALLSTLVTPRISEPVV